MEPEEGFEPSTFRLRGRSFPSDWTDLIGFSLLRLGALSIPLDPDGLLRIDWMIKRMIKGQGHSILDRMARWLMRAHPVCIAQSLPQP
jgi:hypothetical protein